MPLPRRAPRIGRRETNEIVLDDRMASGHHAEIDRDLNGYTVRDLGSTNGTLVNGAPVTEALLTHGIRLRIGNSRFVFKDPAMQDVEVELAHLEEDEGWGMMGEIDLSRARGSKAGAGGRAPPLPRRGRRRLVARPARRQGRRGGRGPGRRRSGERELRGRGRPVERRTRRRG